MTVYVDDMYTSPMGQFGRMKMSHMVADTKEELLAMAAKIGVAARWIQSEGKHGEHFDVAMSARAKALEAGAVPCTMRELSCMVAHRRVNGVLCHPSEAVAWRLANRHDWVRHNPLTATYDTPDGTAVPAELVDNASSLADVLNIAKIREEQRA